jgi:hypothetical protein
VLGEEITSLEMELREAAVRSGELAVTAAAQPNGVSVQLGSLVLVLVESTWGWLGRDDQVLFPMVTEVEIHEQVRCLYKGAECCLTTSSPPSAQQWLL